jgi:O-antigen ligase
VETRPPTTSEPRPTSVAPEPLRPGRRLVDGAVEGLPFALVAAIAALMVERDGGYAVTVWYPSALGVLALGVTLVVAGRETVRRVAYAAAAPVALFAVFVAWGFLTIAWAAVRGDAWDGANRALLYLAVLALLAVWSASRRVLSVLLLVLAVALVAEGIGTTEHVISGAGAQSYLIGARLSEPLGYPNATAALFMVLVWVMVGLASRPWLPIPARGLALGLASMSLTLNVLTQSRGSVYTLPLVAAVYLLLVPGRLRSLATLAVLGVGFAATAAPVLHVYGTDPEHLAGAYRRAIVVGVVWAVIVALAGVMLGLIDRHVRFTPETVRRAGLAVIAAGAVATVLLLLLFTPWTRLGTAWHSFRYAGEPGGATSRFGGLGSNRYDFWRVGLIEFRRHPVQGIGVDNFLVPYLQQRRSSEEPVFPHSLAVDLLSETGLVGTVLFLAFLVGVVRALRRIRAGPDRELAGVLLAGAAAWLLHAQVDWLWEMPVLGILGMGLVGSALGLVPRRAEGAAAGPRARALLAPALLAAAVLFSAASLALPWLAQREIDAAGASWRSNPSGAFAQLDHARRLNPLSDQPDLVAGVIASRLHRYGEARNRFERALERSPDDWYANLELGIAASLAGPTQLAESALRRAAALDPGEPIVRGVLRDFLAGRRIDPDAVDRAFANAS